MEQKPSILRLPAPKDGPVIIVAKPVVTEREIVTERGNIFQSLDAAYVMLNASMAPFQQRWDANPATALVEGVIEGATDGGATWLAEQADLFDKKSLIAMAQMVEDYTMGAVDRLAVYSRQQYKDMERTVNRHLSEPHKTLLNWAWWQKGIEDEATSVVAQHRAAYQQLLERARATQRAVESGITTAHKIAKHRKAIMHLPTLIAEGVPGPIQAFVDNELMDIDKELALQIRGDKRFAIVLEILNDSESTLTYLSYAGLMIDAIPPNFLAYIAGRGGMYLLVELVLLICLSVLSAGAAAAGRVALLIARIGTASRRVSGASRVYKKAGAGLAAFVHALDALETAIRGLHALGPKLMQARSRGVAAQGATRQTLKVQKENVKRDRRCRICHRNDHTTPAVKRGTVKYE